MTAKASRIISILDISSVAFFYIALFIFRTEIEYGYGLFIVSVLISALSVVVFTVYSIINIIFKHNKTNLIFWITHFVNVVWLVTNIIGFNSIKIMGSPL